ncbi:15825_t:CDS:2, partial [Dentiscutata heterogama]
EELKKVKVDNAEKEKIIIHLNSNNLNQTKFIEKQLKKLSNLLFPDQDYNFTQLKQEVIRLKIKELSPQLRNESDKLEKLIASSKNKVGNNFEKIVDLFLETQKQIIEKKKTSNILIQAHLEGQLTAYQSILEGRTLEKRGMVNEYTRFFIVFLNNISLIFHPEIINHVKKQTTVYCGVDPTAPSLHLGNLLTLMGLLHFNVIGHRTIVLIGGATGSIGDPSGRNTERQPMSVTTIEHNVIVLNQQLRRIFNNGLMYASRRGFVLSNELDNFLVMNNLEWFHKMTALEMLNNIGRYFRVGPMLMKDSVKLRMENEGGISFTEFSYQLLQAYDFWYLHNHHQCRIQLGGSDQWGNITAGIDLINKKKNHEMIDDKNIKNKLDVFGITIPLLLTSTGEKFGKSTGNAIWLNENLTSVYEFYQESPEKHYAQEKLASEITELVHG